MKTTSMLTREDALAQRRWFVIDAGGEVLGRVATEAAKLLRGKGKPSFTPHVDCGDFVVVVNADEVRLTGDKEVKKLYYRHSGYPGGHSIAIGRARCVEHTRSAWFDRRSRGCCRRIVSAGSWLGS